MSKSKHSRSHYATANFDFSRLGPAVHSYVCVPASHVTGAAGSNSATCTAHAQSLSSRGGARAGLQLLRCTRTSCLRLTTRGRRKGRQPVARKPERAALHIWSMFVPWVPGRMCAALIQFALPQSCNATRPSAIACCHLATLSGSGSLRLEIFFQSVDALAGRINTYPYALCPYRNSFFSAVGPCGCRGHSVTRQQGELGS